MHLLSIDHLYGVYSKSKTLFTLTTLAYRGNKTNAISRKFRQRTSRATGRLQNEKHVSRRFMGTGKLNAKKAKSTNQIGLGNKSPTMDKFMLLIGIILLDLVGLSGSEYT